METKFLDFGHHLLQHLILALQQHLVLAFQLIANSNNLKFRHTLDRVHLHSTQEHRFQIWTYEILKFRFQI